jgi:hypothetical protein
MDPWFNSSQCDATIDRVVGPAEIGYGGEVRPTRCATWVNQIEKGVQ